MTEPAHFPEHLVLCGPVTAERIRRLVLIYVAMLTAGLALVSMGPSTAWQIFGLGLVVPGGGFLVHVDMHTLSGLVHIGLVIVSLVTFAVSLLLWFATGNVLAPPATWLVLALAAASMRHGYIHAYSVGLAIGLALDFAFLAVVYAYYASYAGHQKRKQANNWLRDYGAAMAAGFVAPASTAHPEFSADDLKRMRFLLDRALQPVSEFNGFEWLDQFQTAAIRYQLNFVGYALSLAQATHLPAFQGYLTEAQRRLILKQADHRVWRYWAIENLWGNLRVNPDPVKRDNIMYTGFCATQMAMFQNASGCNDFNNPESFSLKHPSGKVYSYSLPKLIAAMQSESQRSAFHLIPCEPNWIYPLCNAIGAAAIKSHAPEQWEQQRNLFQQKLDQEFLGYGTTLVPGRSGNAGFALPIIGGALPQAIPCFFMNATLPETALRQWLQLRRMILKEGALQREKFWRIDTGNYRLSRAAAYAATALTAAELGDSEVKNLCLAALDEECPALAEGSNVYRPKASIWAHAVEFMARATTPHAFRGLMSGPKKISGPFISSVSYPDVLVASAYSDGASLRAVFYPGETPSRQAIHLLGLVSGQQYSCEGTEEQTIVANAQTNAIIHLHLDGRKEIRINPIT